MGANVHHERSGIQAAPLAGPLSFRAFLGLKLDRHQSGNAAPIHVQFRKRGVMLCGTVLQASPAQEGSDADWFQVDGQIGTCWVPHKNVRLCSGDGRCLCEAEAAEAVACDGAAASAVPPGNTGTTAEAGQ